MLKSLLAALLIATLPVAFAAPTGDTLVLTGSASSEGCLVEVAFALTSPGTGVGTGVLALAPADADSAACAFDSNAFMEAVPEIQDTPIGGVWSKDTFVGGWETCWTDTTTTSELQVCDLGGGSWSFSWSTANFAYTGTLTSAA